MQSDHQTYYRIKLFVGSVDTRLQRFITLTDKAGLELAYGADHHEIRPREKNFRLQEYAKVIDIAVVSVLAKYRKDLLAALRFMIA